jgi:TonB family protein
MAAALLALAALLPAPSVPAQTPKEPALAEPIPPVRPLAELLAPGLAQEAARLFEAGDGEEGGRAAMDVLRSGESEPEGGHAAAAGPLVLLALARAGAGDEAGALCRWTSALGLDPDFRGADLTAYGDAGRFLESHPWVDLDKRPEGPPLRVPRPGSAEAPFTKPELLSHTKPEYSNGARKARVAGSVILETVLGADGRVTRARALKGLPFGLTASSVDSVCNWKFKPATRDGAPVEVYYVLTVNYQVEDPPVTATRAATPPAP